MGFEFNCIETHRLGGKNIVNVSHARTRGTERDARKPISANRLFGPSGYPRVFALNLTTTLSPAPGLIISSSREAQSESALRFSGL
jgi:hypothetical protein